MDNNARNEAGERLYCIHGVPTEANPIYDPEVDVCQQCAWSRVDDQAVDEYLECEALK